jgi:hypothetical protein
VGLKRTIVLAALAATGWVRLCSAQLTQSPSVSTTIGTVQDLSLDVASVVIPSPVVADFTAGYKALEPANRLTVKSNVNWTLKVRESTGAWDSAPWAKPLSEFQWRVSGGTYAGITGSDATVATGTRTSTTINLDYRILLHLNTDVAGNYQVTLLYTLTNP